MIVALPGLFSYRFFFHGEIRRMSILFSKKKPQKTKPYSGAMNSFALIFLCSVEYVLLDFVEKYNIETAVPLKTSIDVRQRKI